MARPRTRTAFLETEEGQEMRGELKQMADNMAYNTSSTYSPNKELYPDNLMPFEDKHLNYLLSFPGLDSRMYIANLKVRLKLKTQKVI